MFRNSVPSLTPEKLLGDQLFPITCPGCGHDFSVRAKEIMLDKALVTCPGCDRTIRLDHDEKTKTSLNDLRKQLKDLERALKNFGK